MAVVISHFYNEELLLPAWLTHHVPMFDHGVLIDYASTDNSVAICKALAPDWEVRPSCNADFSAAACDAEVMSIERELGDQWKVALNTSEFLCCELPAVIESLALQGQFAARVRSATIVDTAQTHPNRELPLVRQYHHGHIGLPIDTYHDRLLHRYADGQYLPGRHATGHQNVVQYPDGALIAWFGWAPWVDSFKFRKLQIQHRIPADDKKSGQGSHHIMSSEELDAKYQVEVARSIDLRQVAEYAAVMA